MAVAVKRCARPVAPARDHRKLDEDRTGKSIEGAWDIRRTRIAARVAEHRQKGKGVHKGRPPPKLKFQFGIPFVLTCLGPLTNCLPRREPRRGVLGFPALWAPFLEPALSIPAVPTASHARASHAPVHVAFPRDLRAPRASLCGTAAAGSDRYRYRHRSSPRHCFHSCGPSRSFASRLRSTRWR